MHGLRIIIAEADELQRTELRRTLQATGHTVIGEAADDQSALRMIRRLLPDLVIIGQQLPRDGAALAKLVDEEAICPVILLMERNIINMVLESSAERVIPYMIKPVDDRLLNPLIDLAVARFKEVQNLQQEINELKSTIETRKLVEKAKGLLMRYQGLSEAEAFRRIQKQSMNKRTSLKAVAEAIIITFGD